MDLLTVTCQQDKIQMLLQAESVQKFLKPCKHWVIINDPSVCLEQWHELLSPYYENHQLILIDSSTIKSDFKSEKGGWSRQQYFKFAAFDLIDDDYLILDSKNFFIKPTDINEWNTVIGNGTIADFKSNASWEETIVAYANHLNIPVIFNQLSIVTPFVFQKKVLDSIENYREFLNWFVSQNVIESEFLYYSMLLRKQDIFPQTSQQPKFHLLTQTYGFEIFELCKLFFDKDHIKVAGIHRSMLNKFNNDEQQSFDKWLKSKGLQLRHLAK